MEYYSAVENKEILPLVTTHMGPEGIMVNVVSQIVKNTV